MTRSAPFGRLPDALAAVRRFGPLSGSFPGCAYAILATGKPLEEGAFGPRLRGAGKDPGPARYPL